MAHLHIVRDHTLGMSAARKIALAWAQQAETEFGMACTYEEGKSADTVHFTRSGVKGSLLVNKERFELEATLGFLLGAFKDKIEAEVVKNLDALLASKPAAKKAVTKKGA
ncbi:polyhydroxyalkanoic acid synthase [Rhodoferax lacus]|uniref:Polyhydroxyalkanoic acid synthase n=1 Tax=Rhodoferax lacus TaxID=2184758 RepID=A0A3E1RA93_9BURK|nr:polyhydroxyalkanoic acid system family protein [Rhodoferax lacus]RFO95952.1 polyhydroxyalkanoic acid synthase [Rhodoferax lacus]